VIGLTNSQFAADTQGMSRLRLPLATALTLLLLASPASFPTVAGASSRASGAHTVKRHQRTVRRHPSALSRHPRAVTRTRDISHPAAAPRHRTRGFRGLHQVAALGLAAHGTTASGRPAAIAAVLATPCQNTELTPTAGNIELVQAAVLCLINRERAQSGEAPLTLSPQLQHAAEGHSNELVSADYFEHVSPSGVTPVDRIRATGYIPSENVGYVIGENLAWGTINLATPQSIVSAWIASPGHLANILESQYTDTGIGITPEVPPSLADGQAGATYAQEFGVIIG
jgi:uncharacterized protein YkwD